MTTETIDQPFDEELYNGYKEIADNVIRSVPYCYSGSFEDWCTMLLPMIEDFAKQDDFEACKAIKDSFIDYVNQYITNEEERIKATALINFEKLQICTTK